MPLFEQSIKKQKSISEMKIQTLPRRINNNLTLIVLVCILGLVLSACQPEATAEEVCQIDLETGEYAEGCIPPPGEDEIEAQAYPVEQSLTSSQGETSYPVGEDKLSWLLKTWRLTDFAENGEPSKPPFRFLTFYKDGTYAIATEPDLITGDWELVLTPDEATLILDPGTQNEVQYQVVTLEEALLNLRTWQDDVQIDEGYQPDDSGCVCD
jgi:hypothetical protein